MAPVLRSYGLHVYECTLNEVLRQSQESGILYNATEVRWLMYDGRCELPQVHLQGFTDIHVVPGDELIETLASSYSKVGLDETLVVTRSNKRANIFNQGIRNQILGREEELTTGDQLMVVKNNYYWVAQSPKFFDHSQSVALRIGDDRGLNERLFVSLYEIERRCDVITFHVPLTRKGQYATWHLADDDFFHRLSRVPYIINTSRGEVVDNKALLSAMEERRVRDAIIDVWENEPHPDSVLLEKVFIGTPHIAGYSADGKVNADNMVIDAICQHFSLPHPGLIAPPKLPADFIYSGSPLDLYNPMEDSKKLKAASSRFEQLRNNYPLRREKMG